MPALSSYCPLTRKPSRTSSARALYASSTVDCGAPSPLPPLLPLSALGVNVSTNTPDSSSEPVKFSSTVQSAPSPPREESSVVRSSTFPDPAGKDPGLSTKVMRQLYPSCPPGPVRVTATVPMLGRASRATAISVSAALKSMLWWRDNGRDNEKALIGSAGKQLGLSFRQSKQWYAVW